MLDTLLAQKKDIRQAWTEDGRRVVLTKLYVGGNVVTQTTVPQEDAVQHVQIAFGDKKLHNMNRAQAVQFTKAGMEIGKRVFTETDTNQATEELKPGRILLVEELLEPGDVIKLTGISKGKGFAGVVKRWGFKGGPKTHGQSDRQRAPGSIGAGTTPGRVYKNKRMAGRGGNLNVTLENITVVAVDPTAQSVWVKGTIPGAYNSIVRVSKYGKKNDILLNSASKAVLGIQEVSPEAQSTEPVEVADQNEETQA